MSCGLVEVVSEKRLQRGVAGLTSLTQRRGFWARTTIGTSGGIEWTTSCSLSQRPPSRGL